MTVSNCQLKSRPIICLYVLSCQNSLQLNCYTDTFIAATASKPCQIVPMVEPGNKESSSGALVLSRSPTPIPYINTGHDEAEYDEPNSAPKKRLPPPISPKSTKRPQSFKISPPPPVSPKPRRTQSSQSPILTSPYYHQNSSGGASPRSSLLLHPTQLQNSPFCSPSSSLDRKRLVRLSLTPDSPFESLDRIAHSRNPSTVSDSAALLSMLRGGSYTMLSKGSSRSGSDVHSRPSSQEEEHEPFYYVLESEEVYIIIILYTICM